jgi:hypothetical protein
MVSETAKALLRDHIESFEQLEILLLLHRRGGDTWVADAITDELKVDSDSVSEALGHLCRGHLVTVRGEGRGRIFQYGPEDPAMDAAVRDLAQAYAENRLDVMNLMNANALERVRTSALRAFANSFLLGGGGKKNDG